MNHDEIKKIVTEAIAQIQEISGRTIPLLDDETCPIRDIEGFDSVNCVELVCEISSSVGFEIDDRLFIPNVLGQPVTIGQAVDQLCLLYESNKKGVQQR